MFKLVIIALLIAVGLTYSEVASASTLIIPKMGVHEKIGHVLDNGPMWWNHVRPGDGMTISIAGHRTTHTHPFYNLDKLVKGDKIIIWNGGKKWVYRVTGSRIFPAAHVYETALHEQLMLSACTPRGSAAFRLVVYALPVLQ